jgi:hypothetical protein
VLDRASRRPQPIYRPLHKQDVASRRCPAPLRSRRWPSSREVSAASRLAHARSDGRAEWPHRLRPRRAPLREVGQTPTSSHHPPGSIVNDTLLTLHQARVALLGEVAAAYSNAWPSIKTLRRAYSTGQLAVVQRAAGGRVMVWRSELMRWASTPRAAPMEPAEPRPRQPGVTPARQPRHSKPAAPKPSPTATATSNRGHKGAPPRLSLPQLKSA